MHHSASDGGATQAAAGHRKHSRSKSIDSLADLVVTLSPAELLERVAAEAWLYAGLAFKLWAYLGLGEWLGCVSATCKHTQGLILDSVLLVDTWAAAAAMPQGGSDCVICFGVQVGSGS